MKTLIAGLLALSLLGGGVAAVQSGALLAPAAAPTCTDLAGQGSVCHEVIADPANGVVYADVDVDVSPSPPVAATGASAAAAPTCTDVAGQATLCQEVVADPASGVYVFADAQVHPTPPA